MDSTPEAEVEDIQEESKRKYSTKSIMKRLGQINKPEWKWIFAAMITLTLKGKLKAGLAKLFSILLLPSTRKD